MKRGQQKRATDSQAGPKAEARAHGARGSSSSAGATRIIELDPLVIQRALNQALKTLTDPEYQQQMTKLTQASIVNSLQTFQRLSTLSTSLSNMDSKKMSSIVENSINDLTRAFLQYNSDQLVLLQRLSARTLEILNQASQK